MARTPSVDAPLGDFTADMHVVRLVIMAALIGVLSAFVALGLVRLIGLFTNLVYFHRIAGTLASPADSPLASGSFRSRCSADSWSVSWRASDRSGSAAAAFRKPSKRF